MRAKGFRHCCVYKTRHTTLYDHEWEDVFRADWKLQCLATVDYHPAFWRANFIRGKEVIEIEGKQDLTDSIEMKLDAGL